MAGPAEIRVSLEDGVLRLAGPLTAATAGAAERAWARAAAGPVRVVDGAAVEALDTAGAVLVRRMAGAGARLEGFSPTATRLLATVPESAAGPDPRRGPAAPPEAGGEREGRLVRLGDAFLRFLRSLEEVAVLTVDILWWSAAGLVRRGQYRRGSFTDQAVLMGSTAVPLIATIMFLIGAISALQSAATLRAYGASIFVVDMLAIGLARELAPLMAGILVSGRSGSAIASEVATMKFTEEIDALQTMGLNPIRFVVAPKLWAMVVSMPLLTILALAFGLAGGFLTAGTYMGLPLSAMYNRLLVSLLPWDLVTGLIKAVSFAIIITVVGVYRGLNFRGGADGVGRATTASVVTAIFSMIVVDSIWGLIFYL